MTTLSRKDRRILKALQAARRVRTDTVGGLREEVRGGEQALIDHLSDAGVREYLSWLAETAVPTQRRERNDMSDILREAMCGWTEE